MGQLIAMTAVKLFLIFALLESSLLTGLAALQATSPAAAASTSAVVLAIKGAVKQEVNLTMADLKAAPRTRISAKGHDGAMHDYDGVTLQSLLARAGVPSAGELKGKSMALFVVAEAGDGYRAVFSVAELDTDFAGESVLIADAADGKELGADQGPLRLVVPGDKRQGRWVRMLKSISVASAQ